MQKKRPSSSVYYLASTACNVFINKEAMVIGAGNKIDIWNSQVFDKYFNIDNDDLNDLVENI